MSKAGPDEPLEEGGHTAGVDHDGDDGVGLDTNAEAAFDPAKPELGTGGKAK